MEASTPGAGGPAGVPGGTARAGPAAAAGCLARGETVGCRAAVVAVVDGGPGVGGAEGPTGALGGTAIVGPAAARRPSSCRVHRFHVVCRVVGPERIVVERATAVVVPSQATGGTGGPAGVPEGTTGAEPAAAPAWSLRGWSWEGVALLEDVELVLGKVGPTRTCQVFGQGEPRASTFVGTARCAEKNLSSLTTFPLATSDVTGEAPDEEAAPPTSTSSKLWRFSPLGAVVAEPLGVGSANGGTQQLARVSPPGCFWPQNQHTWTRGQLAAHARLRL